MAKHGKTTKKQAKAAQSKPLLTRRTLTKGVFSLAALLVVGLSFTAYSKIKQAEYDLSVIGKGKEVVVQVHDPKCPLCSALKRNLDQVKGEFDDAIHFKVANIATQKGRAFARQQGAGTVTLLLFDKHGKRKEVIEGVTSPEDIKASLKSLIRST